MSRAIFTEVTAIAFAISCDVERVNDPTFAHNLEDLVQEIRQIKENGVSVFVGVNSSAGLIDLRLRSEAPLREIQMWVNRIEKMMQDKQLTRASS